MRIITIGRSTKSDIVIDSPFASSNHAEIYQLDNGDMYIVDKGSGNGTFVNGSRIAQDKEVLIRRNDSILIADRPLDWSLVPSSRIPDKSNLKVIKSIGSHRLNDIQVTGTHVSRFHATIKQKKDGKWYICDHSSNGTTVNGVRIPKNKDYRIKKNDTIHCADVPVANPVTGGSSSKAWVIAGIAAAVCVMAGIAIWLIPEKDKDIPIPAPVTPEKIYAAYAPATVLVEIGYYFEVSALGCDTEYVIYDVPSGMLYDYNGHNEMTGSATGFFISDDGKIITNLHVVNPAVYGTDKLLSDTIKILFQQIHSGQLALADITVNSKLTSICIYPNGCYYDESNRIKCRVVTQSENPEIDLAVIQTMNESLPHNSTYVTPMIKTNLPIASEVYTLGFPLSNIIQEKGYFTSNVSRKLESTFASGSITNNNKYTYQFNATATHGASGSPVFDSQGYLVGVVSGGYVAHDDFNIFEKAENIIPLLNEK